MAEECLAQQTDLVFILPPYIQHFIPEFGILAAYIACGFDLVELSSKKYVSSI